MPAMIIGVAQAIAIIPGTSRSGITMTAGRALGFERPRRRASLSSSAFRRSPAPAFSSSATAVSEGQPITGDQYLTAVFTFLVALATIALLMKLVKVTSFLPFVIYRVALGIVLLALDLFRLHFRRRELIWFRRRAP